MTEDEFWAELQKLGPEEVRKNLGRHRYGSWHLSMAERYLQQAEHDQRTFSSAKIEALTAEQIEIARKASEAAWVAANAAESAAKAAAEQARLAREQANSANTQATAATEQARIAKIAVFVSIVVAMSSIIVSIKTCTSEEAAHGQNIHVKPR